ncbi:MAG: hypothetical protein H6728_00435 [Myxococcales bacterium]|nr:hypothetical protein [Myxococcales bacterium]MCB9641530.1 hypothetical protein [Myxococcales bacterium]
MAKPTPPASPSKAPTPQPHETHEQERSLEDIVLDKLSPQALEAMEREGLFAPGAQDLWEEHQSLYQDDDDEEEEDVDLSQVWGILDFYDEEDTRTLIQSLEQSRQPPTYIKSLLAPIDYADFTSEQGRQLSALPRSEETWIVGALPTSESTLASLHPAPGAVIWMGEEDEALIGAVPFDPDTQAMLVLESLFMVALSPTDNNPRLPAQINVSQRRWVGPFRNLLQGFDIPVFYGGRRHLERVASHFLRPQDVAETISPLRSLQSISTDIGKHFFSSASSLYKSDFWYQVVEDQVFLVDLGAWGYGTYTLSLCGKSHTTPGLRAFANLQDYRVYSLFGVDLDLQARLGEPGIRFIALDYENKDDIPPEAQRHQHQRKWPLASYEAFPVLSIVGPNAAVHPPSEEDYRIATLLCQAAGSLVQRHGYLFAEEGPPATQSFHIPIQQRQRKLHATVHIPHPDLPRDEDEQGPTLLHPRAAPVGRS